MGARARRARREWPASARERPLSPNRPRKGEGSGWGSDGSRASPRRPASARPTGRRVCKLSPAAAAAGAARSPRATGRLPARSRACLLRDRRHADGCRRRGERKERARAGATDRPAERGERDRARAAARLACPPAQRRPRGKARRLNNEEASCAAEGAEGDDEGDDEGVSARARTMGTDAAHARRSAATNADAERWMNEESILQTRLSARPRGKRASPLSLILPAASRGASAREAIALPDRPRRAGGREGRRNSHARCCGLNAHPHAVYSECTRCTFAGR